MTAHILTGSKHQIAQLVSEMPGEVCEAIVFVEEAKAMAKPGEDIFSEMERFAVQQSAVDDSREAVYRRLEAE